VSSSDISEDEAVTRADRMAEEMDDNVKVQREYALFKSKK
jgi:hypothetical protein